MKWDRVGSRVGIGEGRSEVWLGVRCDWKDCDFMASGEGHIGRHVYVKHQKIAIVKCEECGKSVKDYKKHVRVFHDKLRIDSG